MLKVEERYLATAVLVIGTGGAGLRASIELAQAGVQVLAGWNALRPRPRIRRSWP